MEIKRNGSQPSGKGPADWFTGTVRIDPLFQANAPARASAASVTFEPGARTAWHTHPLGQTLIVTAGCGWAQRAGGPIEEIRPGDVVWFPPGEKHWHGAAPTTAMTHIAIQEQLDGKVVDWMEKVSDEQNPDVLRADCGTTLTEWRNKDEEAQAWKKRARSVHDRPRMHGDQL
jgi:quercetin dioxygenase-like cupin family protein